MSVQINLKLSDKMFNAAKNFADMKGFDSLQDFIRKTLRPNLFEGVENMGGKFTCLASEATLAKAWMTNEEDETWKHLQKET